MPLGRADPSYIYKYVKFAEILSILSSFFNLSFHKNNGALKIITFFLFNILNDQTSKERV